MVLNKKGVLEPDALVGIVILILMTIGGVFFLKTFVSGMAMHGMLSIFDQQMDQSCFLMLLQLSGEEYIRGGEKVGGNYPFDSLVKRYEKVPNGSQMFKSRIKEFNKGVKSGEVPSDIIELKGFIASRKASQAKRIEISHEIRQQSDRHIASFCSIPVYGPIQGGYASLYVVEEN